ncbi:LOW QUALITY PROTEIN: uncharacterized protein M6G45_008204 [Spheniscus humboldti]
MSARCLSSSRTASATATSSATAPQPGGPVARARPFSLPVDCYYPRTGSVSSGAVQPTWVPFGSTVAHRRRLRFALDVYDSTWSSRLRQPTYSLGELINIEASVSADPRLPLRVFVDECVASPSAAARPKYKVIADNGCLLDGRLGRSRFLPPSVETASSASSWTPSSSQTPPAARRCGRRMLLPADLLRCHLKAVAEGAGSASGKACSYDRVAAAWRSPDGADCSCCGSPAGCGGRRRRQSRLAGSRGLLGEASVRLGPLGLLSALPSSSPAPAGLPTALEPSVAPPRRPSVPVVRGEKRDSGPALPVPGTVAGHGGHVLHPRRRGRARLLLLGAAPPERTTGGGVPRQPWGIPTLWPWPPPQPVALGPPPGTPLLLRTLPSCEPPCFRNKPVAERPRRVSAGKGLWRDPVLPSVLGEAAGAGREKRAVPVPRLPAGCAVVTAEPCGPSPSRPLAAWAGAG